MYTKGKWRYSPQYNVVTTSKSGIIEGSKTICDINENVEGGKKTYQANGILIATAPEMLDALVKLYNAIDSCIELTPELLKEIKSVILKASGN